MSNDENPLRITQELWKEVAALMNATYSHPFGSHGAVMYCFALGGSFVLVDNGGEVNVMGLNRQIDLPSIPVTKGMELVGPNTFAYRVYAKMTGGSVDYDWDLDSPEPVSRGACGLPV